MESTLLQRTLRANAVFSAASGLTLLIGAVPMSAWLGIPAWLAATVGLALLPFAFVVYRVAQQPEPRSVRMVIAADTAWVIGAAVVIFGFPGSMSVAGLWVLGLLSLAVADFAVLQTVALRRVEPAA